MFVKDTCRKTTKSELQSIHDKITKAEGLVIGVGAGFSASAGLDYLNEEFFKKHYPDFIKKGYRNISEAIADNWYLNETNARKYWGFWANHIQTVFYNRPQLKAYKDLHRLIKNKEHFIITTNADGQFFKGSFDTSKIFAMQGSYGKFQCRNKCHETVYDNAEFIDRMLERFDSQALTVPAETVPRCPKCGDLLIPNLRVDGNFVEKPHMKNQKAYIDFINKKSDKNLVFLELGVGFNTPIIIRSPFEQMTKMIDLATLIRVNLYHPDIRGIEKEKTVSTTMDAASLISVLNEMTN